MSNTNAEEQDSLDLTSLASTNAESKKIVQLEDTEDLEQEEEKDPSLSPDYYLNDDTLWHSFYKDYNKNKSSGSFYVMIPIFVNDAPITAADLGLGRADDIALLSFMESQNEYLLDQTLNRASRQARGNNRASIKVYNYSIGKVKNSTNTSIAQMGKRNVKNILQNVNNKPLKAIYALNNALGKMIDENYYLTQTSNIFVMVNDGASVSPDDFDDLLYKQGVSDKMPDSVNALINSNTELHWRFLIKDQWCDKNKLSSLDSTTIQNVKAAWAYDAVRKVTLFYTADYIFAKANRVEHAELLKSCCASKNAGYKLTAIVANPPGVAVLLDSMVKSHEVTLMDYTYHHLAYRNFSTLKLVRSTLSQFIPIVYRYGDNPNEYYTFMEKLIKLAKYMEEHKESAEEAEETEGTLDVDTAFAKLESLGVKDLVDRLLNLCGQILVVDAPYHIQDNQSSNIRSKVMFTTKIDMYEAFGVVMNSRSMTDVRLYLAPFMVSPEFEELRKLLDTL